MKQTLLFIAIAAAVSVAAVGLNNHAQKKKMDAVELAQFEAWKESKELNLQQQNNVVPKTTTSKTAKRNVSYQSPKMVSESQNAAKTETKAKKGWSKAAKGTAIGAGTGAVLGAVINKKNRVAGAVIGGVIGGGGGYVIGRGMDKKDGRY